MHSETESRSVADIAAWDQRLAAPMFAVTLLHLMFLAGALHLHERAEDSLVFEGSIAGLLAVTPAFWVEAALRWRQRSPRRTLSLWFCVLPPLRLIARDHATGSSVWLPWMGWQIVNRELRSRVEGALNAPMLAVSIAVLPLILVEYLWADRIAAEPMLARATGIATAVVWLAFCVEFLVMASLAEKKLLYCKQHWLDLAIILLPLLAFLRALRLGRLLRLNTLAKTSRMYRLRGVAMRSYRALLVIKAIDRLINGTSEKRLARLRQRLIEQESLLEDIRAEIRTLEAEQAAGDSHADAA
jgi:hypothetical protein